MADTLAQLVEARVAALGFEFVELELGGSRTRPLLRVRIDRPDSEPGHGVSLEDCTRVSRDLERALDARPDLGERYVLEVSSPGLERPLVRRRDFERFAGREVSLRGSRGLVGDRHHLEGELLGLWEEGGAELVRIRLASGEEVAVPRDRITRAQLVFRWRR
jgi:ribosome maturation factor RimP